MDKKLTWSEDGTHATYGKEYLTEELPDGELPLHTVEFYDVEFSLDRTPDPDRATRYGVAFRGKWLDQAVVGQDDDGKWSVWDAGMDDKDYATPAEAMVAIAEALLDADSISF